LDSLKVTARVRHFGVGPSFRLFVPGFPSPVVRAYITVAGDQLPKRVNAML
jgi:hypothetical protein